MHLINIVKVYHFPIFVARDHPLQFYLSPCSLVFFYTKEPSFHPTTQYERQSPCIITWMLNLIMKYQIIKLQQYGSCNFYWVVVSTILTDP